MAFVTVLSPANRQGSFLSASVPIPAGASTVTVRADLSVVDRMDPLTRFALRIFLSEDAGATWRSYGGIDYAGGFVNEFGVSPEVTLQVGPLDMFAGLPGRLLRGEVDLLNRTRIGCSIEVI